MANFAFTEFLEELMKGEIDHADDQVDCMLVMSNTTCDVEGTGGIDAEFVGDFTDDDEYDGATYVRKTLVGKTVAIDISANKGVFDANDITFSTLGVGARSAQAAVLYKFITNDAASIPMYYQDTGGFPFAGNGSDVTIQYAAAGIALAQNAA